MGKHKIRRLIVVKDGKLVGVLTIGDVMRNFKRARKTSPHINIVCKNCGMVEDYEAEDMEKLWSKIVDGLGFEPIGQRIDVYRYCDQCTESDKHSKN